MSIIKGITIKLIGQSQTGVDPFGAPIYEESEIQVENVLVTPTSTDDVVNQLNLTGKKVAYTLGIPKGDTNVWTNTVVEFFGQKWRTVGIPAEGIEKLIPLDWNKKVMVERYE